MHKDLPTIIADHVLELLERERRFRSKPRDPAAIAHSISSQTVPLMLGYGYRLSEAAGVAERARDIVRAQLIGREVSRLAPRLDEPDPIAATNDTPVCVDDRGLIQSADTDKMVDLLIQRRVENEVKTKQDDDALSQAIKVARNTNN